MQPLAKRIESLDVSLFSQVPSQTQYWDRRSLLALHAATAARQSPFTYLEIGSYLGGSLQVLMLDSRCETIISVDSRPPAPPDKRAGTWTYENNSTATMIGLLGQLPGADLRKLTIFERGTEILKVGVAASSTPFVLH